MSFEKTVIEIVRGYAVLDLSENNNKYMEWLIKKEINPVGQLIRERYYNMDLFGEIIEYGCINKKQIRVRIKLLKYI